MAHGAVAGQKAMLNNTFGSTAGPNSPATWEIGLFDGNPSNPSDPAEEANEETCPGYARVTFVQADWAPADADGVKWLYVPVQFPDATDEWTVMLTHFGIGPVGFISPWIQDILTDPIDVTSAGTGPTVNPPIYFEKNVP